MEQVLLSIYRLFQKRGRLLLIVEISLELRHHSHGDYLMDPVGREGGGRGGRVWRGRCYEKHILNHVIGCVILSINCN